ncbi:MAG: hypothetical protein ISS63_07730 [Desulfobacteraceae bacterium]|nr:hypothetical protein [Desulfobacteraceae bacterium]
MGSKNEAPKNKKKASLKTMKADLQDEKIEVPQGTVVIQRSFIGRIKKFKTNVKTSMVNRSKRAEKWHKNASGWPLNFLAKVNRFEQVAGDMIAIQTKTIGHSYNLMRAVVTKVDDIADEILTRAEKHCVV